MTLAVNLPPGVEPRAYQFAGLDGARQAVKAGERPVIVAPTGSGKTTIAALVTASAVGRGSPVLWIAHRRELLFQARDRLEAFGLRCGLILAGKVPDPEAPVQIASIDTLRRRTLPPARVVILDECHRGRASTVKKVLEHYQASGAAILGLTATPQRGDGKGLKPVFTALVETVTGDELRVSGVLVPIRAFGLDDPDMAGVRTGADGDYDEGESAGVMAKLTGRVVEQWRKRAAGRRTLVFACTVDHSRALRDEFLAAGVAADHVDGETPKDERADKFRRLAAGEIHVLANVGICQEGIDLPALEAIVMARPTKSLTLFLQSVGRGVRCAPGKINCVLLDHAGNCQRLGHPEDPREWSLDGEGRKAVKRKAAICPKCSRVRRPKEEVCPCGFRWPLSERRDLPEQTDVDLQEVGRQRPPTKPNATPAEKRRAYGWLCRTACAKGYKIGWARHRYRAKFGVWPRGMSDLEETS